MPATLTELEALAGVGHKTASVVLSQAFGVPAFPVDTHIWRLAMRWGFAPPDASVVVVERALKAACPEETWCDLHVRLILFGRNHCPARKHDASACPICSWAAAEEVDGQAAATKTPPPKKAAKKRPAAATPE